MEGFCDNCDGWFQNLTVDPEMTQFWYCTDCYLYILMMNLNF